MAFLLVGFVGDGLEAEVYIIYICKNQDFADSGASDRTIQDILGMVKERISWKVPDHKNPSNTEFGLVF